MKDEHLKFQIMSLCIYVFFSVTSQNAFLLSFSPLRKCSAMCVHGQACAWVSCVGEIYMTCQAIKPKSLCLFGYPKFIQGSFRKPTERHIDTKSGLPGTNTCVNLSRVPWILRPMALITPHKPRNTTFVIILLPLPLSCN